MNNQPEYKMLHELIELAKQGKKFIARLEGESIDYREVYFCSGGWEDEAVIGQWTYKEIKEPQVVEFECIWYRENGSGVMPFGQNIGTKLETLIGKTWKVTCVEVVE